jgi:hypothetical protein
MDNTLLAGIFGFSSAIIGAIIGGYFTLKATKDSFKNQKEELIENEKRLIKSILHSINDEIETIYERYQETMGSRLESLKHGEPLLCYYPLVSDFFTVYNTNGIFLGRINDNDLRKKIIQTYTLAKGMVDSFRLNNDLVNKYEFSTKLYQETNLDIHNQHSIVHLNSIKEYTENLKQGHFKLKDEMNILLRELRKNGILSEKN